MIDILDKIQRKEALAFLEECLKEDPNTASFSEKIISGMKEKQDEYTWIAECENAQIHGILLIEDDSMIRFLYVKKEERNKGIANSLLKECVHLAEEKSISRIRIHALRQMYGFLKDFGFETEKNNDNQEGKMEYLCGKKLLGKTVKVIVERPYGSLDLRSEGELSVNCGYIEEKVTMEDTDMKNAYIVGVHEPLESFTGVVIALLYHEEDDGIHTVVARNGEVMDHARVIQEIGMVEQYYHSRIVFADTRS